MALVFSPSWIMFLDTRSHKRRKVVRCQIVNVFYKLSAIYE